MPECQKQIPLIWFNWSPCPLAGWRHFLHFPQNLTWGAYCEAITLTRNGLNESGSYRWKMEMIENCVSGWLQPTEHLGQSPEQTNVCHFKQWVSSRGNGISLPSQKFTKTLGLLFVYDKSPISGLYLAVVSHASVTISESHVPQDSDIWHHLTSLTPVTQPIVTRRYPHSWIHQT